MKIGLKHEYSWFYLAALTVAFIELLLNILSVASPLFGALLSCLYLPISLALCAASIYVIYKVFKNKSSKIHLIYTIYYPLFTLIGMCIGFVLGVIMAARGMEIEDLTVTMPAVGIICTVLEIMFLVGMLVRNSRRFSKA